MHEQLGKLEPHNKTTSKILGHFFLNPKRYIVGGIIFILIILALGLIYLFLHSKHVSKKESQIHNLNNTYLSPTTTTIPTPVTFSAWSTYTNHYYVGYSIQIPNNWGKKTTIDFYRNVGNEFEFPPDPNSTKAYDYIDLTITTSTDQKTDICNTLKTPPNNPTYFDAITLKRSPYQNLQATSFIQNEWAQKPASVFGSKADLCFKSDNTTYIISYTYGHGGSFKAAMDIFEKIIRSMTFIHEVYPGWTTYTNKSGAYSFQYPAKILILPPGFNQHNTKELCYGVIQNECNKFIQGSDTMLLKPSTYTYTDAPADYIATSVVQLNQNQTFNDFIEARKKDVTQAISKYTGNYKVSSITTSGGTGISIYDTYGDPSGPPITNYYFSLPNNRILILSENDGDKTLDTFMPQILSAITF